MIYGGNSNGFTFHEYVLPERICKIDELLCKTNPDYKSFAKDQYQKQWKEDNLPSGDDSLKLGGCNTDTMATLTVVNNGGTFKGYKANLYESYARTCFAQYDVTRPSEGYCVAIHPELGTWIPADATEDEIAGYIETYLTRNSDLLHGDAQLYFGTWVSDDPETLGMISLDISAIIPDKKAAMELGYKYNQQAIFDLSTFESIDCGGNGKSSSGKILLESDVAKNYVDFCYEYLTRKFDDSELTMSKMLAERYVYDHVQPCDLGFEMSDIQDAMTELYDDSKSFGNVIPVKKDSKHKTDRYSECMSQISINGNPSACFDTVDVTNF